MLDFSIEALHGNGFRPYYLYRQKYMSGALENVGWTQPGRESLYNIVMMEELQSVLSLGAGGVTKLIRPGGQEILRLANPKYPQDYLSAREKILGSRMFSCGLCFRPQQPLKTSPHRCMSSENPMRCNLQPPLNAQYP